MRIKKKNIKVHYFEKSLVRFLTKSGKTLSSHQRNTSLYIILNAIRNCPDSHISVIYSSKYCLFPKCIMYIKKVFCKIIRHFQKLRQKRHFWARKQIGGVTQLCAHVQYTSAQIHPTNYCQLRIRKIGFDPNLKICTLERTSL